MSSTSSDNDSINMQDSSRVSRSVWSNPAAKFDLISNKESDFGGYGGKNDRRGGVSRGRTSGVKT